MSSNTDEKRAAVAALQPAAWPVPGVMRYDRVKESVARHVYEAVILGGVAPLGGAERYEAAMAALFESQAERRRFEQSLKALADECYDRIVAWDVSCVEKLRELFPSQFPPSLSKGALTTYIGEQGHWYVESEPWHEALPNA